MAGRGYVFDQIPMISLVFTEPHHFGGNPFSTWARHGHRNDTRLRDPSQWENLGVDDAKRGQHKAMGLEGTEKLGNDPTRYSYR